MDELIGCLCQMKAVQNVPPGMEQKEASALRRQLQLLEEEKAEWEQRSRQAEEQAKDLRFRGDAQISRLTAKCCSSAHNV